MNARFFIVLFFTGAVGVAYGQKPTPSPTPRTSDFRITELERNPFWPIGWKPPVPIKPGSTEVVPTVTLLRPEDFRVTSISLQPLRAAIINNKAVVEGDSFMHGTMRVKVTKVRDGDVVIRGDANEVTVPLRTQ